MPAQLTQRPPIFFNHSAPQPSTPQTNRLQAGRRRLISMQAGLAELMLVIRLRARTRRDLAPDTLENAARIIEVTSRHWFAEPTEGEASDAPC